MATFRVVLSNQQEVQAEAGKKLSEVMQSLGIKMDFPCGGRGRCGQCKVKISSLKDSEKSELREVLACSFHVEEDLWVEIPEGLEEDKGTIILTTGAQSSVELEKGNSGISKTFVAPKTSFADGHSFWEGLTSVVKENGLTEVPDLKTLQQFAVINAEGNRTGLTVVKGQNKFLDVEAGDTSQNCYGLAVDIGTTTVVGYLTDLNTGEELAVGAELNGQRIYGADVISRVTAAQDSTDSLKDLQRQVIKTINNIVQVVTQKAGVEPKQIYALTLAGNTCMHHLVLGLNPAGLGRSPFLPVFQRELLLSAKELGIGVNSKAQVWVFPVIAGFVGGDTVAAVLAADLHHEQGVKLLVDIGTNGELVVNAHGRMVATSAAAGPALEGAQITFGMRAEAGAVSRVRLVPELKLEIIGGGQAKGICGSGLVDLLAELVRAKLISNRGKFVKPEQYEGPEYLRHRVQKGDKGYKFVLFSADENGGKEIFLSQEDISQLQLAKGALRAAMELLVRRAGVQGQDVEELLLAGAFGNFLDVEQAQVIGLIPDWAAGRVRSIGNAAGEGAKLALLSQNKQQEAETIAQSIEFLEMAGKHDFEQAFIKGMLFN